jgi:hypothetical protein
MFGSVCVCVRTMEECDSLVVFKKEPKTVTAATDENDFLYIHIFKLLLKPRHLTNRVHCMHINAVEFSVTFKRRDTVYGTG